VGHQYAFVFDVPTVHSDPFSRYVLRNMGRAEVPLGLHWHHFGHPILPPIVPDHLVQSPAIDSKILVYLPFEDNSDIVATLRPNVAYDFFIYGTREPRSDNGNLHHREYSRAGFLADLTICNAGFELPSEALHLGKRLLVKPLHGQLEQGANAKALAQLGLGRMMRDLDAQVIARWLAESPRLAPCRYPRTAAAMARWIDAGRWTLAAAAELSRDLWGQVVMPAAG
jgi:uncharacterized protein (TIGR00661 family)